MAHEDYKEMLPAHALSSLDADDARALDQHLEECAECRRELADWENTAAALALTATPAEPSREVRHRIMSAVRSENPPQQASKVVPFPATQTRRQMLTSFGRVGAVAAAVLFLVLIIWIFVLWQQNRELRRENDMLSSQMQSVQEDLTRVSDFASLLSAPGSKVVQLYGVGPGSVAHARLVYSPTRHAILMAADLPPSPAGKEYQLWFLVGKNPPIPGKTFIADDSGRGELVDEIPPQALDSSVFAVTLEPAGGVTAPTGDIYLRSGR